MEKKIITKEEATRIALSLLNDENGVSYYELKKVGTLTECWENHEDYKYFQENESMLIYRVDESIWCDSTDRYINSKPVLCNEDGEYWFYALDIKKKISEHTEEEILALYQKGMEVLSQGVTV